MKYMPWLSLFCMAMISCSHLNFEKGNGEITSQKRILEEFTEVHLTGNFEIGLKKGGKEQIVIVTDSNLLEYIDTEVENEVLVVTSSKKIQSREGIKIFITYQELSALKSIGASVINTDGPIVSSRFEMEIPGASLIDVELDVSDLEVMLAGAGSVKLRGNAENQTLSLNGVGNLEAFDLESRSCKVTVSGMGGVEINVKENLQARVNGIGSIKYKGNPQHVDDKVKGLGTIAVAESNRSADEEESI